MADLQQNHAAQTFGQQLDRFESQWKSGSAPELSEQLADVAPPSGGLVAELIQLDLEYRWKQYSGDARRSTEDRAKLPEFPHLEDYAELLPRFRTEILVPELFAEEYRVRVRWGDRPGRQDFLARGGQRLAELEAALKRVEEELRLEENADQQPPSRSDADNSTRTFLLPDEEIDAQDARGGLPATLGRYRLEARIGQGGFGEVWRAFDPHLDRRVAIKILRYDARPPVHVIEDFKREGMRLAKVGPLPGIVVVFDVGEEDGRIYLVSELIEGENLAQRRKRQPLSRQEAAALVANVASALHHVHCRGIVHRDIKPGNILIRSDGSPVLVDFGLAASELEQSDEPSGVLGTLAYMPPEQVAGESNFANPQADIYSLGVVLYELLTGRRPFVANGVDACRRLILQRKPWPPRTIDHSIPPELERICLKCLEKDPADRYTSAKDLADALRPWASPPKTHRKWKPAAVMLASLLLLGGAMAAAIALLPDLEPTPTTEPGLTVSEIPWTDRDVGVWEVQNDGRSLMVSSTDEYFIAIGGERKSLDFHVDLEHAGRHGLGIFFGLRGAGTGGPITFFTLACQHRSETEVLLECRERTLHPRSRANDVDRILGEVPVEKLHGGGVTLHLRVENEEIAFLKINEVEQELLADRIMDYKTKNAPLGGRFGIWCCNQLGHATNIFVDGESVALRRD
ncbi:MAG: serine/threonine-protein kinase [Pirellulaceae bacterium]